MTPADPAATGDTARGATAATGDTASAAQTVTADDLTTACDRELVGMLSAEELQAWARETAARDDVRLDPPDVLAAALAQIGACPPGELRDVVRRWMSVLHPPRCGG